MQQGSILARYPAYLLRTDRPARPTGDGEDWPGLGRAAPQQFHLLTEVFLLRLAGSGVGDQRLLEIGNEVLRVLEAH